MKNVFLGFLFVCFSGVSQEKFDSYNSSYFKKDYSILASEEKDKTVTFYVQTNSMDSSSSDANLLLNAKNIETFKTFVFSLKETYGKWKQTAIDNKVTELNKPIEYESISFESAFKYGKWHFDFRTNLSAKFRIVSGNYLMVVSSDALEASNNQYIKSDGYVIVFANEKEFDDLLNKLDTEKALTLFKEKAGKADLFKN